MSASSQPDGKGDEVTVNKMGLLLCMLGPKRTHISPVVAPAGIVMVIEVALHELMVTGASFRTTVLVPCEEPNPEPEITTCVPTGPVVVERLLITRGVTLLDVIDTLSKYCVAGVFAWPPPTANPT